MVSCKSGEGIQAIFDYLFQELIKQYATNKKVED
jgi:hypothetical protein